MRRGSSNVSAQAKTRDVFQTFRPWQHLQSDVTRVQAHLTFSLSARLAVHCSVAGGEASLLLA